MKQQATHSTQQTKGTHTSLMCASAAMGTCQKTYTSKSNALSSEGIHEKARFLFKWN